MKLHFKIRNKTTGLFAKAGRGWTNDGKWGKEGKIWNSSAALKNHLRLWVETVYERAWKDEQYKKKLVNTIPEDWEVIPVEVTYNLKSAIPAREFFNPEK
jgi:hypothetical protein